MFQYSWNQYAIKDLKQFLEVAEKNKNNVHCNTEEYNKLKTLFPLPTELTSDFHEKFIEICSSDDEEVQIDNKELNVTSVSSLQKDQESFQEIIKDSLLVEKSLSATLLEDIQKLDSLDINKCFGSLCSEFSLDDVLNLWKVFDTSKIDGELVVQGFIEKLFLPKIQGEFKWEANAIFLELSIKHQTYFKKALVTIFMEPKEQISENASKALLQYVSHLQDKQKADLLQAFVTAIHTFHSSYIPIIDTLWSTHTDNFVLCNMVELMALTATEFDDDNAYGKLLFKVVSSLENNVSDLENALKCILGVHKSIWKIKIEKIVKNKFNETLTQSFI